ncbi:MAG: dihydrofolate reductase [Rhodoglobus sp.]
MSLGLIWAQGEGGVIGFGGAMPWHVPEDLAHFKEITLGGPVVMGRKTWDSLNPRFRPLPGRRNIVITRQQEWVADGVEVAHSLKAALELVGIGPTWVIGGGQIFRESIALADRLEVTEINGRYEGDAHAPEIDRSWVPIAVDPTAGWATSRTGIEYRFLRYERVS